MSSCEYCDMEECCTQCEHLVNIVKHPWNEDELKGPVSEVLLTGCAVRLMMGDSKTIVVNSKLNEHGSCEMFTPKETV